MRPRAFPATAFCTAAVLAAATPATADDVRLQTAHVDRVVLMPTAFSHPRGTFFVSDVEIALLQAGYAFADGSQVTISTVPLPEDIGLAPLDISVKHALYMDDRVQAAVIGSVTGLLPLDGGGFLGRVGGVITLCATRACTTSVHMSTNVILGGPATIAANSIGAIVRLSERTSLLFEADVTIPFSVAVAATNGLLVSGAWRFGSRNWGLDLGLGVSDAQGAVIPFFAATHRWLP